MSSQENHQENAQQIHPESHQEAEMLEQPQDLKKQLVDAEEKANQYWDKLLRQQAEMENIRRRAERGIEDAHKYALEKFVRELLPVVDSLERAMAAHKNEESSTGSLLDGVSLTLKMFYAALEKFGVQQVNPAGQTFDPALHQAVSTQIDADAKPGTVLSVLQVGYLLNDRLIRPALVMVSK